MNTNELTVLPYSQIPIQHLTVEKLNETLYRLKIPDVDHLIRIKPPLLNCQFGLEKDGIIHLSLYALCESKTLNSANSALQHQKLNQLKEKQQSFLDFLNKIEEKLQSTEIRSLLPGQNLKFVSNIRIRKGYTPLIKTKLAKFKGRLNCSIYDAHKELTTSSQLNSNQKMLTCLELSPIWISGEYYGANWNIKRIDLRDMIEKL